MHRTGHRGKVDGNHGEIMDALRDAGMKPVSTAAVGDGFPDICVGFRGICVLLEVKDGSLAPSARKLTAAEAKFRDEWPGPWFCVGSAEEAVIAVTNHAKTCGVI